MSVINITKTESKTENCLKCKNFTSFMDFYDDILEPHEMGFCNTQENGKIVVDEELVCNLFLILKR